MDAQPDTNRKPLWIGLGIVAVIAVLVGVFLLTRDDDDDPVVADDTTTTTSLDTTTTTATDDTTTTVTFQTVDLDLAVFPDPTTSRRFDDPVAAATAFATDLVGYSDPVVGEFEAGDSRSGEVQVRATADGAPTVVLLRQLEDDTWFVIGSTTDSIQLATPEPRSTISSPQELIGMAYAFEGTVNVRLYVDGTQEPIAETVVTGRGDGVLGDFSGELEYTDSTGATHGVLVLSEASGDDGAAVAATVVRVGL
jgi:hypothetical protein